MDIDSSRSRMEQIVEATEEEEQALDDFRENGVDSKSRESSKHRSSKDKKKSRREGKDHRRSSSKERERSKTTTTTTSMDIVVKEKDKERRKEDGLDREKDRKDRSNRDKVRERETEKEHDHRGREREREREKERGKEKDRGRDREREREKDREKRKDRDGEKEKEKNKDSLRDKIEPEKGKEKGREKKDKENERETDRGKERSKDRKSDKAAVKNREESHGRRIDNRDVTEQGKGIQQDEGDGYSTLEHKKKIDGALGASHPSSAELEERILKMKEERLRKKSEGRPEVLAWINKSRKLEEKMNAEKEKALHLSKVFEEQDNVDQGESEDDEAAQDTAKHLAGVKVLHGLDKVIEGGAVVLTLKDQSVLANGDINEEIDMLENVEIGEQKQRDEAYKAAKKKSGIYEDKFSEEAGSQKKMLPQYDDPVEEEGVTLDAGGRFSGEAEKKLEELRKRIQGVSTSSHFEDLNSSGRMASDYYTQEEMLQFKKPKKKKSLRKKEKLDLDALEAEAISTGLGVGDRGSRYDGKRQAAKEEQDRSEVEMRNNAYQSAYAKAEEASKALRQEQVLTVLAEEDENPFFGDDDEDFYKSLENARKLAIKKQDEEAVSGPQAVALRATTVKNESIDNQNFTSGEPQENKIIFTEMEEFVLGLQLDEESHKHVGEAVFMDEDEVPQSIGQEKMDEAGGWTEVNDSSKDEDPVNEEKEEIVPDGTIHEVAVGKGLSGVLQLLKDRGTLKESIDWGGRNMDKKKSKLVGIYDNDGTKEIRIERTDEFGRIMTPKEAFRMISHKFHGKGPGKMKQEKRMKQYHEELKLKQMKNSDTPSQSLERMREAQASLKTPYLVLSGHVKPGQTSDPRSGFATVEKDLPGGLTPMLGDRKVEHFLGIKRKAEPSGNMGPPKKPKT